jgi:hypothetical protein
MSTEGKKTFRIHLGLVLAEALCIPAFIFETYRAIDGNLLSWAYVVEWPVLGLYAIYMWARMLREERGEPSRRERREAREGIEREKIAVDDPDLVAWNQYLAKLHAHDDDSSS